MMYTRGKGERWEQSATAILRGGAERTSAETGSSEASGARGRWVSGTSWDG